MTQDRFPANGDGAVIYVRVSSEEQVANHSLKVQEEDCRRYCKQHGHQVFQVFREEGVSAKTTNRPAFMAMIDYLDEHAVKEGIGYVIVYKVDRFTRHSPSGEMARSALLDIGVKLRSSTEQIDETPSGRFMERTLANAAQYENEVRSERTRIGMQAAAHEGKHQHRAPLGYLRGGKADGMPSLVPDLEKAPIIREVFEMLAFRGVSQQEAREYAIARGLTNAKGAPISRQTFNNMIHNAIYAGHLIHEGWGIHRRGDWEPLVTDEVWESAQRAPHKPSDKPIGTKRNRNNPDFPLRRVVRCGKCGTPCTGSASTGRSGERYSYYNCREKTCDGFRVPVATFTDEFIGFLRTQSLNHDVLKLFGAVMKDVWKKRTASSRASKQALEERIAELDGKILKTAEVAIDVNSADRETYHALLERHRTDKRKAEDQIRELAMDAPDMAACISFATSALSDLPRVWNHLQVEKRAGFVKVLYPAGLEYEDGSFGTAETPWHIKVSDVSASQNEQEVPPMVLDWNQIADWLWRVDEIRRSLEGLGIRDLSLA